MNREIHQRLRLRASEERAARRRRQRGDGFVRVGVVVGFGVAPGRIVAARFFGAPREPGDVVRAQHGDHLVVERDGVERDEVRDERVDASS